MLYYNIVRISTYCGFLKQIPDKQSNPIVAIAALCAVNQLEVGVYCCSLQFCLAASVRAIIRVDLCTSVLVYFAHGHFGSRFSLVACNKSFLLVCLWDGFRALGR